MQEGLCYGSSSGPEHSLAAEIIYAMLLSGHCLVL